MAWRPPWEHPFQNDLVGAAEVGIDDGPALNGHLVNGAIAHVDELFGMADREGRGVADVTGVGACGGITGGQRGGERGVGNRACPSSIADALKLAVPADAGIQTSILMSQSLD